MHTFSIWAVLITSFSFIRFWWLGLIKRCKNSRALASAQAWAALSVNCLWIQRCRWLSEPPKMGISNFNVASNYCWSVSTHQIKRDSLLSLNILIDKDELLSLIILADIAREVLHVTPESFFMLHAICATIMAVRQKQVRPGKLFIIQRITSPCKPFQMHLFILYLFKTVKSEINESKFK